MELLINYRVKAWGLGTGDSTYKHKNNILIFILSYSVEYSVEYFSTLIMAKTDLSETVLLFLTNSKLLFLSLST